MNALLRQTISYHDYREDFYHAFLAGIFTGAGYMVDSNKEHGERRSDVVVYDSINGRVAVFEAKYTKVLNNLEASCRVSLILFIVAVQYLPSYDLFSNRKIISFPYKKAKGSLPEGCPDQE